MTAEQLPSVKKTLMLRRNEKLMKNNSIPHNNGPCESIGCDSNLTEKIPIKVGDKGTIFLFLCKNCKSKFSANDDLVDEVIAADIRREPEDSEITEQIVEDER